MSEPKQERVSAEDAREHLRVVTSVGHSAGGAIAGLLAFISQAEADRLLLKRAKTALRPMAEGKWPSRDAAGDVFAVAKELEGSDG